LELGSCFHLESCGSFLYNKQILLKLLWYDFTLTWFSIHLEIVLAWWEEPW
jgi:hypothetical protein